MNTIINSGATKAAAVPYNKRKFSPSQRQSLGYPLDDANKFYNQTN
jgi:hypothetical protein